MSDMNMLLEKLGPTIIDGYSNAIDGYFLQCLSKGGKISIPTMQRFMQLNSSYMEEMLGLYCDILNSNDIGVVEVDVNTMAAQGALFDGLCFVYDCVKDEYTLATMNFDLLYDLGVSCDMLRQVVAKNKKGIVKAYRIDIEYINSEDYYYFKPVNARDYDIDESKADGSDDKRFYLIPYLFSERFMMMVKSFLKKGMTLRIHQSLRGVEKTRFISENKEVLKSMCDIPSAVDGVKCQYYPLRGFFYAPVVGASGMTAMVTNVNVFDVFMLKVASENDFERYNVHKPVNSLRDMLGSSLVCNKMMQIKAKDDNEFAYLIASLPYNNKYFVGDVDNIGGSSISRYLNSITEAGKEKVYKKLGVAGEIERRQKVFGEGRPLTSEEMGNLNDILKKGICRLVIQKADGKLSSIFCTNSTKILSYIYGNDYISNYEGFSMKFYSFYNWICGQEEPSAMDIMKVLRYYGLTYENRDVDVVLATVRSGNIKSDYSEAKLKSHFSDRMGINLKSSNSSAKRSNNGSTLLVRTITAYLDADNNPAGYYKYLDSSKIVSGIIF